MRREEDKDMIENRKEQTVIPVKDKIVELGINLNTIFTALVLAGILWVGTTLDAIKNTLNENAVAFTEMRVMVNNISDVQKEHLQDYKKLREEVTQHKLRKKAHDIPE